MVRAIAHKTEIKMDIIYLGTLDDLRNPSLHQQHHDIQILFDPYITHILSSLENSKVTQIGSNGMFSDITLFMLFHAGLPCYYHLTQHGSTENSVNPCQQLRSCYTLRRCISCGKAAWHQRSTASIVAAVPAVAWESGSTAFVC